MITFSDIPNELILYLIKFLHPIDVHNLAKTSNRYDFLKKERWKLYYKYTYKKREIQTLRDPYIFDLSLVNKGYIITINIYCQYFSLYDIEMNFLFKIEDRFQRIDIDDYLLYTIKNTTINLYSITDGKKIGNLFFDNMEYNKAEISVGNELIAITNSSGEIKTWSSLDYDVVNKIKYANVKYCRDKVLTHDNLVYICSFFNIKLLEDDKIIVLPSHNISDIKDIHRGIDKNIYTLSKYYINILSPLHELINVIKIISGFSDIVFFHKIILMNSDKNEMFLYDKQKFRSLTTFKKSNDYNKNFGVFDDKLFVSDNKTLYHL
jgi:hypothetical protein